MLFSILKILLISLNDLMFVTLAVNGSSEFCLLQVTEALP